MCKVNSIIYIHWSKLIHSFLILMIHFWYATVSTSLNAPYFVKCPCWIVQGYGVNTSPPPLPHPIIYFIGRHFLRVLCRAYCFDVMCARETDRELSSTKHQDTKRIEFSSLQFKIKCTPLRQNVHVSSSITTALYFFDGQIQVLSNNIQIITQANKR